MGAGGTTARPLLHSRPDKSHTVGLDSLRPNETRILVGVCGACGVLVRGAVEHRPGHKCDSTFLLRTEALRLE